MIICIVGPTAVGKTKLSVELAKRLHGEIINADSTQVYKGLDIGTCKVTEEEKEGIPHHLFDIVDVDYDYTVFDYQKDCRNKIEEIKRRGNVPILVGGTGLYLKAALYQYEFTDVEAKDYSSISLETLQEKVLSLDPSCQIDFKNRRRVERTLAMLESSKKPSCKKDELYYPDTVFIGLTIDRAELYERINQREEKIFPALIKEARPYYENKIHSKALRTAIGYKELYDYFDRHCTKEEALATIQKKCRNYAKRQYTWFRHQMNVTWFETNYEDFQKTVEEIYQMIKKEEK